ncbi:MAG: type II toxin-antitoxin system death-on-curing family toxin, partial [Nitrososphaeraceae archaeon]
SINNSFDNIEQYPTIEQKSARLAFGIINNHAFIDGNKRIGILTMLMTLKLNNIKISYTQQELINLGLSIANKSYNYENILKWIKDHKY